MRRRRHPEDAFTLVELLLVLVIVLVLMAASIVALRGARATSRAQAMTTTSGIVAEAVSSFNRMRPPVGATDPLIDGSQWTHAQTEAAGGLYSITGERLLASWPDDPYAGAPIVIERRAACPTTAAPGRVVVCRPAGGPRAAFRVLGGARKTDGTPYVVFDKTF